MALCWRINAFQRIGGRCKPTRHPKAVSRRSRSSQSRSVFCLSRVRRHGRHRKQSELRVERILPPFAFAVSFERSFLCGNRGWYRGRIRSSCGDFASLRFFVFSKNILRFYMFRLRLILSRQNTGLTAHVGLNGTVNHSQKKHVCKILFKTKYFK